ncbi:MAG: tyrosine-protein phosphatase [Proteobacteria bacterium]|jgi:protein tyrosine/serine phosphatase|nr:tyrosine-protein phosphatase [Pseudomonadota bacterium]MDA1286354.1 tyrosine-protein phosphatase [Pseudomonadota bacterium]
MSLWQRFKSAERGWRNRLGEDISSPAMRRRAWRHYLFIDHGVLRVLWRNFHEIDLGVYRSNQPSPRRLAQFRAMGVKTILNLRGVGEHSHYLFEKEACAELGLTLIDHTMFAADLVSRDNLIELEHLFRTIEKPFVMHCKSGADRTGLAAVLYLMVIKNQPVDQALDQLHWRFVHLKQSKNGILDFFFEAYQRDAAGRDISLSDWIRTEYDPQTLRAEYFGTA